MVDLQAVLQEHYNWVTTGLTTNTSCQANLQGAHLQGAHLQRADLQEAKLQEAKLQEANLQGANLQGANLWGANLQGANLQGANLWGANLQEANLQGANLWGANLQEADLQGANLQGANLPAFQIPQEGSLIVWKKISSGLCKLLIPENAKRTASLVGRKCRAEFALILSCTAGCSRYADNFNYKEKEMIYPDKYDDDIRIECSNGIHFFLTKEEAEQY